MGVDAGIDGRSRELLSLGVSGCEGRIAHLLPQLGQPKIDQIYDIFFSAISNHDVGRFQVSMNVTQFMEKPNSMDLKKLYQKYYQLKTHLDSVFQTKPLTNLIFYVF